MSLTACIKNKSRIFTYFHVRIKFDIPFNNKRSAK